MPLLEHSSPTAIAWLVVAIWIRPAIERVLWSRLQTHISEEVWKRMQPTIANSDSTGAVAREVLGICTVTAAFHAAPRIIFDGAPGNRRAPMYSIVDFRNRYSQAAAAFGVSALGVKSRNIDLISTLASKEPDVALETVLFFCGTNGSELPESFPCKIKHMSIITKGSS